LTALASASAASTAASRALNAMRALLGSGCRGSASDGDAEASQDRKPTKASAAQRPLVCLNVVATPKQSPASAAPCQPPRPSASSNPIRLAVRA
jgi:hypothetical protein